MSKRPIQTEDKYVLRFPDGMRDRLKEAAEASGRSMNAEIVQRLEDSFEFDSMRERFAASAAIEESYELLKTSLALSALLGTDFLSVIRSAADGDMDRFNIALGEVRGNPTKFEKIEASLKNLAGWADKRSEDERSKT